MLSDSLLDTWEFSDEIYTLIATVIGSLNVIGAQRSFVMITGKLKQSDISGSVHDVTFEASLRTMREGVELTLFPNGPFIGHILNYMTEAIPKVLFKVLISRSLPSLQCSPRARGPIIELIR